MPDSMNPIVALQTMVFWQWASGVRQALALWRGSWRIQQDLLLPQTGERRRRIEIADGPSLTDRYGRRGRDIDPERDV
jgi:hypothetical protein